MYNQIYTDIQQEYYKENYSNDGQRFVAWYLRNIHNLNTIEAKDCITDGANDNQIDAVYINNQDSIIYIIQGKFMCETISAEPLREVLSAWTLLKRLEELQEMANLKLKSKINEIAYALSDGYTMCFEFITTAKLTNQAESVAEAFAKNLAEDDSLPASLNVIDADTLKDRYNEALNESSNYIEHSFVLESGKYLQLDINGIQAILAVIPLKDCISIPGIKDGRLFSKNVRQSLGVSNKVNKGIAKTIKKDPGNLFFLHNGITAICSNMTLENNVLHLKNINIVNGCQSLTTLFSCGESAKKSCGYILFKFYIIRDSDKADSIANCTNSQSAVKARDLRSNDKTVLAIKKNYEQAYPNGYLVTKRGEVVASGVYDKDYVVQLTDLGKEIIAWHSQRPTISYSETKIFDSYFSYIFKSNYKPDDIIALHHLHKAIEEKWVVDNPLRLDESLLAMKGYAIYHHLYAVSLMFSEISNMSGMVPSPSIVYSELIKNSVLDIVVNIAGKSMNRAFKNANSSAIAKGKIFSPQNWIKNKASIQNIEDAIRLKVDSLDEDGGEVGEKLVRVCRLSKQAFESRWSAD